MRDSEAGCRRSGVSGAEKIWKISGILDCGRERRGGNCYREFPSPPIKHLSPKQPFARTILAFLIPMLHVCLANHSRRIKNRHDITSNELLHAVVRLFTIRKIGRPVEPKHPEVNIGGVEGTDFKDASDIEAGVRGVNVGVGLVREEDMDGGVEGELFFID